MSGSVDFIARLVDQISGPARNIATSLRGVETAAKQVGQGGSGFTKLQTEMQQTASRADQLRARLTAVGSSLGLIGRGIRSAGFGLATAGMAAVTIQAVRIAGALQIVKSQLLGTAIEFENYQTVLEMIAHDKGVARNALDFASSFAFSTPYELGEVVDAMKRLASYGVVNLRNLAQTDVIMRAIGDTSAAMGKSYEQGAEAVADLLRGQASRWEEWTGINAVKKGNAYILEFADSTGKMVKKTIDLTNRQKALAQIVEILNGKFGGAMAARSKTIQGQLSNIQDWVTRFKKMIIDAGLGDEIRRQLQRPLDWLAEMNKIPEAVLPKGVSRGSPSVARHMAATYSPLATLARNIAEQIKSAFADAEKIVVALAGAFKSLFDAVNNFANSDLGQKIGGWKGIFEGLLALPFLTAGFQMAAGLAMMASGILRLTGALASLAVWVGTPAWAALFGGGAATAAATTAAAGTGAGATAAGAGAGAGAATAATAGATGGAAAGIASATVLGASAAIGGLFYLMAKAAQQKPFQDLNNDLRAKAAARRKRDDDLIESIRAKPKVDTGDVDKAKDKSQEAGQAIQNNLNVTAKPSVDTSGLDAAISKAQQALGYIRQLGATSPGGAVGGGGGGGSGGGGGRSGFAPPNKRANLGDVNIKVASSGMSPSAMRKFKSGLTELAHNTFGDGTGYKSTMNG